jgi:hypothetical protein
MLMLLVMLLGMSIMLRVSKASRSLVLPLMPLILMRSETRIFALKSRILTAWHRTLILSTANLSPTYIATPGIMHTTLVLQSSMIVSSTPRVIGRATHIMGHTSHVMTGGAEVVAAACRRTLIRLS